MNVDWVKRKAGSWCQLKELDLDQEYFDDMEGVYIIWYEFDVPGNQAEYVGQGIIRDRLKDHCGSDWFPNYSDVILFVTWADVPEANRDGVERYLAEYYEPTIGQRYPCAKPIEVNIPFRR